MLWLAATLAGALFQSWRTAVQQSARASLSVNGAGLIRYFHGLPVPLVRRVGQVGVSCTPGSSRLYLRETVRRREVIALFCVGLGVGLALAGAF